MKPVMRTKSVLAAFVLAPLAGCSIAAVDYGKIRHADYVADPRCTAQPGSTNSAAAAVIAAMVVRTIMVVLLV